MLKKIKKYALVLISLGLLLTPVFSQDNRQEPELSPEELLELESAEEEKALEKEKLPQELQQNFIIVEPPRVHELNPQITNYSSDSQILKGFLQQVP